MIDMQAASARSDISAEDFDNDPHAAKYRSELIRHPDAAARVLAKLDTVAAIGDADEREATGLELNEALGMTRRSEGRSF